MPRLTLPAALLFASGLSALIIQSMWFRELRSVFGASTPATATVLGLFMGGVGLGSALFGRRAERHARPLVLYGWLEVGVAASAALSPLLIDASRAIYLSLGGVFAAGSPGSTAVRVLLAALCLGVPATLMGGTFPAMARATSEAATDRRHLAVLYGANALGAVLGAALSTFALLEVFGVRRSLWLACLVLALVGVVARGTGVSGAPIAITESRRVSRLPSVGVLVAAFGTGFAFFLSELVWYRLSAPLLGGSTYSFGIILTVALLGIGGGAALYAFLGPVRPTPGRFATTCALQAAFLLLPFTLGDDLALFAYHLREFGQHSFLGLAFSWVSVAAIIVLPVALVSGYQFPLLLGLAGEAQDGVGEDTGAVYAANTFGAIVGSFLGGFGAMPMLGALGSWRLAAMVLLLIGVPFMLRALSNERTRVALAASLVVVTLLLAGASGPGPVWRHSAIGSGRASFRADNWNLRQEMLLSARRGLLEEHDGVEASLAFQANYGVSLITNGKSDGSSIADALTQVGFGILAALVHGHVEKAYVIGLGTGQSAGWLAEVPGVKSVEVVEIEPQVLRFADLVKVTNHDVLHHPKVTVTVGDGRETLVRSSEKYDLIISEPSNPYRAGIASFYTLDFYQQVAERLNDDGIFAQWVQAYEVQSESVQLAAATLSQVFPEITVWHSMPTDMILVASKTPQVLDVERMRALVAQEPLRSGLRQVLWIDGVEGILSQFDAGAPLIKRLAAGTAEVNTDDLPLLELQFARSVGRVFAGRPSDDLAAIAARTGFDVPPVRGSYDVEKLRAQRGRAWLATSTPMDARRVVPPFERAWARGDWQAARQALDSGADRPQDPVGRLLRAHVRAMQVPTSPEERAALRAELADLETQGLGVNVAFVALQAALTDAKVPGVDEATARAQVVGALSVAVERARTDPWLWAPIAATTLRYLSIEPSLPPSTRTELAEQLAGRFAGYTADGLRLMAIHALTEKIVPPPPICLAAYQDLEPAPIWHGDFLTARARCYAAQGHPLAATAATDVTAYASHGIVPIEALLGP